MLPSAAHNVFEIVTSQITKTNIQFKNETAGNIARVTKK